MNSYTSVSSYYDWNSTFSWNYSGDAQLVTQAISGLTPPNGLEKLYQSPKILQTFGGANSTSYGYAYYSSTTSLSVS